MDRRSMGLISCGVEVATKDVIKYAMGSKFKQPSKATRTKNIQSSFANNVSFWSLIKK